VLAGLLGEKQVVRRQIRKSSGQGERWYDAWRLPTVKEYMTGKIEEPGLMRPVADEASQTVPVGDKGGQAEPDDTDWLDEQEAARGEQ
jgi:hypothetical protein